MGGTAKYKVNATGEEFESQRELIKALGEDEAFGKGYSASGIVVNKHPTEVTLIFQSGQEMTVAEAVDAMKAARGEAQAAPEAPVGEGTEEAPAEETTEETAEAAA